MVGGRTRLYVLKNIGENGSIFGEGCVSLYVVSFGKFFENLIGHFPGFCGFLWDLGTCRLWVFSRQVFSKTE